MNYEELEGKEINFLIPENDHYTEFDEKGIVAGCEYDIGITIVSKTNKTNKLLCLNKINYTSKEEKYEQVFQETVKMIQDGTVNGLILCDIDTPRKFGRQATCAFE